MAQNGIVLEVSEPGQNRFNRDGSQFLGSNRWFSVFGYFSQIFGFLREPDRIGHRSPVEPTGPVRFLKPWLSLNLSTCGCVKKKKNI